jgi:hypothetical protein
MFQALLANHQEAFCKQHLVYCVRIMSVGCGTFAVKVLHVGFTILITNVIYFVLKLCVITP